MSDISAGDSSAAAAAAAASNCSVLTGFAAIDEAIDRSRRAAAPPLLGGAGMALGAGSAKLPVMVRRSSEAGANFKLAAIAAAAG